MPDIHATEYAATPFSPPNAVGGTPPESIALPRPSIEAGMPLMTALAWRQSTRIFAEKLIALDILGELLWSADGVNRPETGGRTAPTAHGFNEIEIYVALPHGVYRYEPVAHRLTLKRAVDARNMTGYQDFVGKAPLDLVYVLKAAQVLSVAPQQREFFAAVATGAICQNVSLYCASVGLGTVVRGWINHRILADVLRLNEDELPILAQTVGWPMTT